MGDVRTTYLEYQGLHLEHANLVEGDVHVPLNGVVVVVDAHRLLEFDGYGLARVRHQMVHPSLAIRGSS